MESSSQLRLLEQARSVIGVTYQLATLPACVAMPGVGYIGSWRDR